MSSAPEGHTRAEIGPVANGRRGRGGEMLLQTAPEKLVHNPGAVSAYLGEGYASA